MEVKLNFDTNSIFLRAYIYASKVWATLEIDDMKLTGKSLK